MKGVQQWHALDLVDHRDEGWANEVIAAVHVMELVLDSDPVRQEGLAADFRMASGWLAAQLQAPGHAAHRLRQCHRGFVCRSAGRHFHLGPGYMPQV